MPVGNESVSHPARDWSLRLPPSHDGGLPTDAFDGPAAWPPNTDRAAPLHIDWAGWPDGPDPT